jgi:hypothetical protein
MPKNNKKKMNIFLKFFFCWKLLCLNPLVSYCHYCRSYKLRKIISQESENQYIGTYLCENCGATMKLAEKWEKL